MVPNDEAGQFQVYDDDFQEGAMVPRYPINNISTLIVIFYGARDTLCDAKYTREHLKSISAEYEIPSYEHLDFLFADNAPETVYPLITE